MAVPANFVPWPGGLIPYLNSNTKFAKQIAAAIAEWARHTVIRFELYTPTSRDVASVAISSSTSSGDNTSQLGYSAKGKVTTINLQQPFLALHELGHAIGLIHEHCRSDRDSYVRVNYQNLKQGTSNPNYILDQTSNNQGLPYNRNSVMHYGAGWQNTGKKESMTWLAPPQRIHWIDKPKGGVREVKWTELMESDLMSVNRAYLEELGGNILITSLIESASPPSRLPASLVRPNATFLNTNLLTADRGASNPLWNNDEELSVDDDNWMFPYNLMVPCTVSGSRFLFCFSETEQTFLYFQLNSWGAPQRLSSGAWQTSYSILLSCQIGGTTYLISYAAGTGAIKLSPLNTSGVGTAVYAGNQGPGLSLMAICMLGQTPYLISYAADGSYQMNQVTTGGFGNSVAAGEWGAGYTLLLGCQIGGAPYLIRYRPTGSAGTIELCPVSAAGVGNPVFSDSTWSNNWSNMAVYYVQGKPFLLSYDRGSGAYKTLSVTPTNLGSPIVNGQMQKNLTTLVASSNPGP